MRSLKDLLKEAPGISPDHFKGQNSLQSALTSLHDSLYYVTQSKGSLEGRDYQYLYKTINDLSSFLDSVMRRTNSR